MFTCKVLIRFNDHLSHVTVREDRIHVFKYNNRTCDFGIFDTSYRGQEAAGDFIVDSLPTTYYSVTFPGDSQV